MNRTLSTTGYKVLIRTNDGSDTTIEVIDFEAARAVARQAKSASNIMVRLEFAGLPVLRWDRNRYARQNCWRCMELDAAQPTGSVLKA